MSELTEEARRALELLREDRPSTEHRARLRARVVAAAGASAVASVASEAACMPGPAGTAAGASSGAALTTTQTSVGLATKLVGAKVAVKLAAAALAVAGAAAVPALQRAEPERGADVQPLRSVHVQGPAESDAKSSAKQVHRAAPLLEAGAHDEVLENAQVEAVSPSLSRKRWGQAGEKAAGKQQRESGESAGAGALSWREKTQKRRAEDVGEMALSLALSRRERTQERRAENVGAATERAEPANTQARAPRVRSSADVAGDATSPSSLEAESALLLRALEAIEAGDRCRAQAHLHEHRRTYGPAAQLQEERERLTRRLSALASRGGAPQACTEKGTLP